MPNLMAKRYQPFTFSIHGSEGHKKIIFTFFGKSYLKTETVDAIIYDKLIFEKIFVFSTQIKIKFQILKFQIISNDKLFELK
ncbi:hypothetical protein BpHYR1_050786 [Brachionus plicatilis]|uniref:Uncharacterized protein n=1 Tax=Brachionus plicatilis TaxID=10195 RepID=A0A3M7PU15_BRAPC|nr:hypothetical protein BpHYR1_050786 [Brachionus plicatilis]